MRAWGTGGRQVRTDPKYGDIYDHHAVVYEYPDNVHVHAYCRQQGGCWSDTSDHFFGTKGHANILKNQIDGENPWRYRGPKGNMYDLEHEALFESIRSAKPINNGLYMSYSTMMAILGRMVDYTGKAITWDEAINSDEKLAPGHTPGTPTPPILPGPDGRYPVAMPGRELSVRGFAHVPHWHEPGPLQNTLGRLTRGYRAAARRNARQGQVWDVAGKRTQQLGHGRARPAGEKAPARRAPRPPSARPIRGSLRPRPKTVPIAWPAPWPYRSAAAGWPTPTCRSAATGP